MGATPRWLLVTALLPERSTTAALVEDIFASLSSAATELDIALVGGHTEITIGLDRVILVGQMLGEADPEHLLDIRNAQPGDAVLLCAGIAIEGTSILATEAANRLTNLPPDLVASAQHFIDTPGISVVPAARALLNSGAVVRGLHDPTEGGLASAIAELSAASGLGIEIDEQSIPIYEETAAICAALDLDPLGLIASGALAGRRCRTRRRRRHRRRSRVPDSRNTHRTRYRRRKGLMAHTRWHPHDDAHVRR